MASKRERQLRKLRERRVRSNAHADPNMRFQCGTCGLVFEHEMNVIIGRMTITNQSTGETTELPPGMWQAECPRCHQPAVAINQVTVTDGEHTVTGFADTEADVEAIRASIAGLRELDAEASVEEVAAVLEAKGLGPVAQYVRDHALELSGLGVGVVGVVIALLAWLYPMSPDQPYPQPVPDGITYDQMEQLVEELRDEVGSGQHPADQGDEKSKKGHAGPSGAEDQGRGERRRAHD